LKGGWSEYSHTSVIPGKAAMTTKMITGKITGKNIGKNAIIF
jgi:hypothetical protein